MPRLSKIGAAALAAFGWTSGSAVSASYLVVAGGGSGGYGGGGGGAGGLLTGTASLNPTLSYTVTVGAGGSGVSSSSGNAGSNSVFNSVTANGGGFGATYNVAGGSGGSGGGGGANNQAGGAATSGQGNAGGAGGANSAVYSAGGGGGASAVGGTGNSSGAAGSGGNGTTSSISGSSVTYAGGGGGSNANGSGGTAGSGGTGGGGAGSVTGSGTAGTANLGGGGGGAWAGGGGSSGNGGSGIVIISYVGAQQFGGGNVTSDGTNTIHTFTTSGTLSPLSTPLTTNFLVVAGGGAGAGGVGGGGGAGGFRTSAGTSGGGGSAETALTLDTNSIYTVTVGAGGTAGGTESTPGTNGGNSSIASITSTGGGCGGSAAAGTNGQTGGSGGGQGGSTSSAGSGTANQGYGGGTTSTGGTNTYTGGGGGAGAVGGSYTAGTASGAGGAGVSSSISGSAVTYGGGGGGGRYGAAVSGGAGGAGGGGAGCGGSATTRADGSAGTANTGGAGGGGSGNGGLGGAGGSGVVIISYAGTQQFGGGVVTFSGGNTIHTFTSSGYLSPIKTVNRSLRFRSSASAYLNRTTTSSVTNNKIFTYSMWVKRGIINDPSAFETLIGGGPTNADTFGFGASTNTAGDFLHLRDSAVGSYNLVTTQLFRDPSSWYHFVLAVDTTQATASNRVKIYLNGVQITSFSTASYPAQNYVFDWNTTSTAYVLGRRSGGNAQWFFDGYMTEVNAIDGAALTPSSFGAFNSYGVWQPTTYGGSYGTNGFYLTFGNNTSTTTLGYDTSPQGNNWTTNNISVTAGVTYDSMTDVPTLTSATVANYNTLNPDIRPYTVTPAEIISNGNLTLTCSSSAVSGSAWGTTLVTSGKFYFEATLTTAGPSNDCVGFSNNTIVAGLGTFASDAKGWGWFYQASGSKTINGTTTAYGSSYTTGDVIGIALDTDNLTITFYKNNTSQGQLTGLSLASGSAGWLTAVEGFNGTVWNTNFGQRPFTYTAPSGFVALNTYNLSTPTIPNGAVYFAATTYTGNGTSQSISNSVNGTSFQPDFVWYKDRSVARDHALFNVTSGATYLMSSNNTSAESAVAGTLTSFNSNGYSIGSAANANGSGETYVGWQWKANGTGVTNTSGSITSTVSANTTAGFAVVTYTGTGANATVGHGLGVTPSMVIIKQRTPTVRSWAIYSSSFAAPTTSYIYLDNITAMGTGYGGFWNSTAPTSSVFSIGTDPTTNENTGTYVAYVFAAVAGYSAFGSYTGNGSSDGVFVFLGLRARFLMIRRTDSTGGWVMLDTARDTYNDVDNYLYANSSATDAGSSNVLDINSNGFKIRNSWTDINASGGTYIYMAFAENPFKYANAR